MVTTPGVRRRPWRLGAAAWLGLNALLPAGVAAETPACTPGTEFTPALCPVSLPAIRQLRIERRAAGTARGEPDCASFRPGPPALYRFLAHAGSVSQQDWRHLLDWSACQVSGTLTLRDGRQATWQVSATRMGMLQVAGQAPLYLYCPDCDFKPF